jgi:hypothetical protein
MLAAGVDVCVPWEMRAPVSIVLLLVALGLASPSRTSTERAARDPRWL